MELIELAKEHWGKVTGGVGLGAGGIAFLAKDAIREWWADRRAERAEAHDERRIQQGIGDKLADQLLAILREDLRGNAALLKELTLTMGEFRDMMRTQQSQGAELMVIAKETRESQKWIERQYGRKQ